jgi:hypothetical protein
MAEVLCTLGYVMLTAACGPKHRFAASQLYVRSWG